uniref:succinate dehydrogenase subunit 4 n=1 Tax=Heterosiphonia pulchra TaxID=189631 RepID=UPI002E7A348D|nr:succinate dehydrogenase subunit 4 [Heterosiphonia pulchra]WQF69566.1 succinate dehydrogenase subunit 4 [Heterosiphonia pulchra]
MMFINYFWFISQFSSMFIILGLFLDYEFIFLVILFFYVHLISGLKSILFDYIHKKKVNYFIFSLLKILVLINFLEIINFFY